MSDGCLGRVQFKRVQPTAKTMDRGLTKPPPANSNKLKLGSPLSATLPGVEKV